MDGWTPCILPAFELDPGVLAAVDLLLRWRADETAVDTEGQTTSDMLGLDSRTASEGDFTNVRLLLARAPADKVWHRQGWLVVLRSRASKARTAVDAVGGPSDGKGGEGLTGTGGREGEEHKVARRENGEGASITASEQARRGDGGAEEGVVSLSGAVALLFAVGSEGVFRTVVGYLWCRMRTEGRGSDLW